MLLNTIFTCIQTRNSYSLRMSYIWSSTKLLPLILALALFGGLISLHVFNIQQSKQGENLISQESSSINRTNIERIRNLIFPNRSHDREHHSRRLQFHPKPAKPVPCVICSGLKTCSSLNGLLIQEKYFPNNLALLGTCYVTESLGQRVKSEIFGNGKTFRDTSLCQSIVMQYLCLFWGSDNEMYTNLCIYQESVTSGDPSQHIISPRPPCRSFCVQVADICANDPDYINLCYEIMCPPTEDECAPGNLKNIL